MMARFFTIQTWPRTCYFWIKTTIWCIHLRNWEAPGFWPWTSNRVFEECLTRRSPVLDQPVILSSVGSVAHNQYGVTRNCTTAIRIDIDSWFVVHKSQAIWINCYGYRSNCGHSLHQLHLRNVTQYVEASASSACLVQFEATRTSLK